MPIDPRFEVRITELKGRGLFCRVAIPAGTRILTMEGRAIRTDDLPDEGMAMQIGPDLWLHSPGESLDDCCNHSCRPNSGFLHGEPALYSLRAIAEGEEITWDYSTSIDWPDWSMICRCGSADCRGTVRAWSALSAEDRRRLTPIALTYLACR